MKHLFAFCKDEDLNEKIEEFLEKLKAKNPAITSASVEAQAAYVCTAADDEERTLLQVCCEHPLAEELLAVVDFALRNGADPNAQSARGSTALHEICSGDIGYIGASELEVIDKLIKAGAFIDKQDSWGYTPLLQACMYMRGDNEDDAIKQVDPIILRLIERGAGVNLANIDGITPLHVAVVHHDAALVTLLLQRGASPFVRTHGTRTLYDGRLILLDNHAGARVAVGSSPIDLCTSEVLSIFRAASYGF